MNELINGLINETCYQAVCLRALLDNLTFLQLGRKISKNKQLRFKSSPLDPI
jgi:hypothetical protein